MLKESDFGRKKVEQIDVMDLIINCLSEHEKKFDQLIDKLENKVIKQIDAEELRQYGMISIEDKRGSQTVNYGRIVKSSYGVNGLELSTDRGYTVVFSGSRDLKG